MPQTGKRRCINRNTFYGVTLVLVTIGAVLFRFFGLTQFYAYAGRTTPDAPGAYNANGYAFTLVGAVAGVIAALVVLVIAGAIHGQRRIPFGAIWLSMMAFLVCFSGSTILAHYMA